MFNTEWRVVDNYNGYGGKWAVLGMSELAFRIESDGTPTNLFLATAVPQGGLAQGISNYPALLRGHRGFTPTFVKGSFIPLDSDSDAEEFFDLQLIADETEVSGPVYQVNMAIKRGEKGDDGETLPIDPADYGTPVIGQMLTVAAGEETFELTYPKVPRLYLPASISSAPDGSTGEYTMAQVDISAGEIMFDWKPDLRGNAITVGSTADIRVDLIVRLNDETGGNIIARGRGLVQKTYQPNIQNRVESGTNVIAAGAAATLYFRTKKMSGTATYGAAAADAAFSMLAVPA